MGSVGRGVHSWWLSRRFGPLSMDAAIGQERERERERMTKYDSINLLILCETQHSSINLQMNTTTLIAKYDFSSNKCHKMLTQSMT